MAEKTAWSHVMGEPVATPPGERAVKAEVDARFDGSFHRFCEWMNETFKNPDEMRVRVVVGNILPNPEPIAKHGGPARTVYAQEVHKLVALTKKGVGPGITLVDAEKAVQKVHTLASSNQKIEAIKALREASGIGLKEAKDFVEALPATPTPSKDDDELPF